MANGPGVGKGDIDHNRDRKASEIVREASESVSKYGELAPLGGGDSIPLLKKNLLAGRRESCDIVLRFKNVSAHHCRLMVKGGYWYIKDLKSLNGIKVNQMRVSEKRLDPGDEISIAKHRFRIMYSPHDLGAVGPPPADEPVENIFNQSLLDAAGLKTKKRQSAPAASESRRIEVTDDSAGQLEKRRRPL